MRYKLGRSLSNRCDFLSDITVRATYNIAGWAGVNKSAFKMARKAMPDVLETPMIISMLRPENDET